MARTTNVLAVCAAALLVTAARGTAAVTVDKRPPAVEYKTFDSARPPAEMPPLKGAESAVTQSNFECSVALHYQIVSRREVSGECRELLKIKGVDVTVRLNVVIWLPHEAPGKLVAHEEGHRRIAERVYQSADAAARRFARSLDGRTVTARGPDCRAAETRASKSAADQFCQDYLNQTAYRAGRVGDIYDRLTAHGTRAEPAEDEAIRQAFAEDERLKSATQPSTSHS